MGKSVFITATGTDVGKTFISSLIVKELADAGNNTGYYKAALSDAKLKNGELVAGDADYVYKTANLKGNPNNSVSYIFKPAVSPHLAAQMANVHIKKEKIQQDFSKALNSHDFLLMEGSGGIVCPISIEKSEPIMLTDIIKTLELPIVIVSGSGLGSINSVLLTVNYAQTHGINIRAIIMNRYHSEKIIESDNKKMIAEMTGIPVYTCENNAEKLSIPLPSIKDFFKDV